MRYGFDVAGLGAFVVADAGVDLAPGAGGEFEEGVVEVDALVGGPVVVDEVGVMKGWWFV